jgi:hypothetical protein
VSSSGLEPWAKLPQRRHDEPGVIKIEAAEKRISARRCKSMKLTKQCSEE